MSSIVPYTSYFEKDYQDYLGGQILIAMPNMIDARFSRSVVYVCAHSADGAMGIVINQPAGQIKLPELLVQLNVIKQEETIQLPAEVNSVKILRGGPVDTQRGFVLHTTDFFLDQATLSINQDISLTATVDILKAIAHGTGPHHAVLALGFAGWAAGQLEHEIQENGWLNAPADADFLFDPDMTGKYAKALKRIGIDLLSLSSQAGHS